MARGRFISSTLGDSERWAGLATDAERILFILLVANADAEGRFLADPITVNGKVLTRLGWTPEQVEERMHALDAAGLITLYMIEGKRYGYIERFHEHQTIRRKPDGSPAREAASRLPELTPEAAAAYQAATAHRLHSNRAVTAQPPRTPAAAPDLAPRRTNPPIGHPERRLTDAGPSLQAITPSPTQTAESSAATAQQPRSNRAAVAPKVQVQVQVEGEGEENLSSDSAQAPLALAPAPATPARAREGDRLEAFAEIWNQHRGPLPAIRGLNEWRRARLAAVIRRSKGYAQALEDFTAATQAVAADAYWIEQAYGFDNLVTGNKVVARAEQWRARGRRLTGGNARMAGTLQSVVDAIGGLGDEEPHE